MKILIILFSVLLWAGCQNETEDIDTEIYEADATWVNMLAADGCAWHFQIQSGDSTISAAASKASQSKIDKALGKLEGSYSFTPVRLRYSYTGSKANVQCGWGHTATFDEINVVDINKK